MAVERHVTPETEAQDAGRGDRRSGTIPAATEHIVSEVAYCLVTCRMGQQALGSVDRLPDAGIPVTVSLPGIPVSVRAARQFVRDMVGGCPRADDLVLAVSELASNAIAWSASGQGGAFTVQVQTAPCWARIEVTDLGPAVLPMESSNGWGLGIAAAITDRAGASTDATGVRTAWAEVTWPLSVDRAVAD
jgi:hypothetical protein